MTQFRVQGLGAAFVKSVAIAKCVNFVDILHVS
jgi:hypothetical protein